MSITHDEGYTIHLKGVSCYRLNYSSCEPLGVTDFVRTSSRGKVGGDIYTFFSFSFIFRENYMLYSERINFTHI